MSNWKDLDGDFDEELKINKVKLSYKADDDKILGLILNENDPSKNKIKMIEPKKIKLIQSLTERQNNYLLDRESLMKFISALGIDSDVPKTDVVALTKRTLGMKVLINLIDKHSDKISFLLDEDFKNTLINVLMKEVSSIENNKNELTVDSLEQKIHLLRKYTTERDESLKRTTDIKVRFVGHKMSVSKNLKSSNDETYTV